MAANKQRKKLMERLIEVPKQRWNLFAVLAALVLVLPLAWDLLKPAPDVEESEIDPTQMIYIFDDADLLTDAEEQELFQHMLAITEFGNAAFITNSADNPISSTQRWAEDTYYSLFGNDSGVVLAIDMYHRYIYLCCSGAMYNTIRSSVADTITDNIYRYARSGDYFSCAAEGFDQVLSKLQGNNLPAPMKHATNSLLALAFSAVLVFVIANIRTRMRGTDEKSIFKHVAKTRLAVEGARSTLLKEEKHRHVEASSSSGGGGGGGGGWSGGGGGGGWSGGGGGGGGFSGGGGGHGF